jgi:hypothetical protein
LGGNLFSDEDFRGLKRKKKRKQSRAGGGRARSRRRRRSYRGLPNVRPSPSHAFGRWRCRKFWCLSDRSKRRPVAKISGKIYLKTFFQRYAFFFLTLRVVFPSPPRVARRCTRRTRWRGATCARGCATPATTARRWCVRAAVPLPLTPLPEDGECKFAECTFPEGRRFKGLFFLRPRKFKRAATPPRWETTARATRPLLLATLHVLTTTPLPSISVSSSSSRCAAPWSVRCCAGRVTTRLCRTTSSRL